MRKILALCIAVLMFGFAGSAIAQQYRGDWHHGGGYYGHRAYPVGRRDDWRGYRHRHMGPWMYGRRDYEYRYPRRHWYYDRDDGPSYCIGPICIFRGR